VLIVLFDQMLPQYADEFHMPNFRRLRDQGTYFKDAYLGYMASETVIAHNVIPSGLLPKNMGYTDEAYRDHANLFGKGKDAMHITGDLSLDDFVTIQKNHGKKYPKLADYLHKARPGTKFITVGEKSYAVDTATGASGDIGVRLSSRSSNFNAHDDHTAPDGPGCPNLSLSGPSSTDKRAWRGPDGKNVPGYLTGAAQGHPDWCGRFFINSDKGNDYGTTAAFPSWMYPSEGNRFWPGNDPAHLGGDTWVADAATTMMRNENWSGMFVTMGAIDKAAHMWGAQADQAPKSCNTLAAQTHVKCAAENADRQLGKLLDQVRQIDKQRGGRTLVVLTADHGATYGKHFYGKTTSGAGDSNWYFAPPNLGVYDAGSAATAPDKVTYSNPSDPVKQLNADGNLQFSYQSTALESWLLDHSVAKKRAGAKTMLAMPGVTASYWRDGDHFVLYGTNSMTDSERSWWKRHGQEIVDTMAADDGPDVIGLEHDRSSYGVYGDHGGAQESVQRVPMVFWAPGMRGERTGQTFRTPDVLPTILQAMGISPTAPLDGRAHSLGH
jgi:arylsulfatase A-like enzyme